MTDEMMDNARPFLMGKAAAVVNEKLSAKEIIDGMVSEAVYTMQKINNLVVSKSKL